jgi:GAF domain-containing protein
MNERSLRKVADRLAKTLDQDLLIQQTTYELRDILKVNRILLYYFYSPWKGQVTFESVSDPKFSIFGKSGPDQCFSDEYAALYLQGRIRAISNIETEPIDECHREFLKTLKVRANLVVPILSPNGLWGLLVAHHCEDTRLWSLEDIRRMQNAATLLSESANIRDS